MQTRIYITDINKKLVEVTDYKEALSQAKGAINFLEGKQKRFDQGHKDEIIFPDSLANWKYILIQLEKLALNNSNLLK
jgi:hypothetical protein